MRIDARRGASASGDEVEVELAPLIKSAGGSSRSTASGLAADAAPSIIRNYAPPPSCVDLRPPEAGPRWFHRAVTGSAAQNSRAVGDGR